MRNPDVFPRKDNEFDTFQQNLIKQVDENKDAWGISESELVLLKEKQAAWQQAWALASNPNTRTRVQTTVKTAERAAYQKLLRPFIQLYIHANKLMDAAAKLGCGIKPHNKSRKRIPAPGGTPALSFVSLPGKQVRVWFKAAAGQEGSNKRAMPKGVCMLEIVFKTGKAPKRAEVCTDIRHLTYSPNILSFEKLKVGTMVYAFARWLNAKGEPGPWCAVQSFVVL